MDLPNVLRTLIVSYLDFCTDRVPEEWEASLCQTTRFETFTTNKGTLFWVNRKFHREDGPALEWNNGDKEWFMNNKHHRIGGPAIEYNKGLKQWYENGVFLKEARKTSFF